VGGRCFWFFVFGFWLLRGQVIPETKRLCALCESYAPFALKKHQRISAEFLRFQRENNNPRKS
jgi:hypothetical protein